jgi:hypothetical protein
MNSIHAKLLRNPDCKCAHVQFFFFYSSY